MVREIIFIILSFYYYLKTPKFRRFISTLKVPILLPYSALDPINFSVQSPLVDSKQHIIKK